MPTYLGDALVLETLDAPAAPMLTRGGAAGTTTYEYQVVARRGSGHTAAGSSTTVETGPETLSATHYYNVKPVSVPGATSYDIYRVQGGPSQGKIGAIQARVVAGVQQAILHDTGLTGDASEAPDDNTTGTLETQGNVDLQGGVILMTNLPTADPLVAGQLWNDSGILTISSGGA